MLDALPPSTTDKVQLSVVIMTKNEAAVISRCLGALMDWADDVVVLDSGSTDGTRQIAASLGARVFEQPWLGFSAQRNRAVELARHDWVLCLDADEVVDARLARAIREAMAANPDPRDGFCLDRRDEFFGKLFPNLKNRARNRAFIRLFHRAHGRWNPEQLIHEEVQVPGRSIPLPGILLHWRSFTLGEQLRRYLGNVELEVEQMQLRGKRGSIWRLFVHPPLRFAWCYIACGGWRMGEAGIVQGMMVAHAEWLRWASLWEAQKAPRVPHPPAALINGKGE
ncbi:glycosyltransferase family 2 protein [Siccirubricoccus sp. KC 17139]|uniref:Glycosyltransferase family 2 protein n=1 Tax=Siccirubricoccus soli TaxID=2899147 RepID=A0ABT1D8Y8_9PROT|nr:glycosyltransferase family 2 protein [Siccirubricoccus soli]MCO6418402.1 glycosyltransferase family 2 protein [Siccirubricoccus soli]MCP2684537.1 glycosyltransferase family 2 protein [Siccirubricoccus soli]